MKTGSAVRSIDVIASGDHDQAEFTTGGGTYAVGNGDPSAMFAYGWKAFPEEWTAQQEVCPCGTV